MAQSTVFSIRMDSKIKDSLDEFCSEVGVNANTLINMFARVVVREKRLPFDVGIPNAETRKVLEDADKGIDVHHCNSLEEMLAELNAE